MSKEFDCVEELDGTPFESVKCLVCSLLSTIGGNANFVSITWEIDKCTNLVLRQTSSDMRRFRYSLTLPNHYLNQRV